MKSEFKPAGANYAETEWRKKRKTYYNAKTGETTEMVEPRELLKNIRGEYTLEFFDENGELTQKIEAENAVPAIYSQLGVTRALTDIGLLDKTGKHIWNNFSYPKFFDEGFIFFTQENTIQQESIKGAIPSGEMVGMSTINSAYTGEIPQVGTVNTNMTTVESGHQVTRLTYVTDFTMEKANGQFDTVWLGHYGSRRYEQDYQEMLFKTLGHFKEVDYLSPAFNTIDSGIEFAKDIDYPEFLPLDGWTYWGQTYQISGSATRQGYYLYDHSPDMNEVTLQRVEALNGEFDDCAAGGPGVYQGKPAILKRQAVATNMFEFVYFDLYKDNTYQLNNPRVVKLKTESLPNHADIRLIGIKSFDDALYAFFKNYEASWGVEGVVYCVKYSADGSTYYGHTTYEFGPESYNISQDTYKLKSCVDVYRLNDVDYFVIAHDNNLNNRYATVYTTAITNENKVVNKDKLNAFCEVPGNGCGLWRQVHPNELFFSQSYGIGGAGTLRLWALMVPFSHTKIQTVSKDASQSMRLTYTVEIKHNITAQYLGEKDKLQPASLEEPLSSTEEPEENISIFSKIKSVFSSK